MKIEVVDGILRPRIERGADWGAERKVLVRLMGDPGPVKEMWWTGGHKYWSGIGETSYARAELSLVLPGNFSNDTTVGGPGSRKDKLCEGRFSDKVIKQHAEKINAFFGADVAGLIQRGKTVVIEKGD